MARQEIILGTPPQGLGGDTPRAASMKINAMTLEIFENLPTTSAPLPISKGGTAAKSAPEARIALGLGTAATASVTTSSTDATAGRVTRVGDFGVGGNDGPDMVNWNGITASGLYRFSPGAINGPGSGVNYGTVLRSAYQISTGTWTELTQSAQEPRLWVRSCINGATTAHFEAFTSYNSTRDPQAAGGLMWAGGISGFGVFKFANGQMCIIGPAPNTPSLPANAVSGFDVTIPSGFISNTAYIHPEAGIRATANNDHYGVVSCDMTSPTNINVLIRNGPTAQVFQMRICVWGQWK